RGGSRPGLPAEDGELLLSALEARDAVVDRPLRLDGARRVALVHERAVVRLEDGEGLTERDDLALESGAAVPRPAGSPPGRVLLGHPCSYARHDAPPSRCGQDSPRAAEMICLW